MIKINNTLKYGASKFEFRRQALFKCNAPFDLTDETSCLKFEIGGTQPAETSRRVIFKIDDELFRFVNGVLDKYVWRGELNDILKYGNTVEELLELENISAFVGKKVFPIIALDAPSTADVFPRIKISLKVSTYNDIYTAYRYSPIFYLTDNAKIYSVRKIATTTGNATELTECRIKKNTGEWSDWQNYLLAENQAAAAIQFRTKFVVSTLDGTDVATVNNIDVKFIDDLNKSAAESQTFFTKFENYDADLKTAYLLIKHAPFENCNITAWACLNPAKQSAVNVQIGLGTGAAKTYTLPNKFVAQDTLHVEINGVPTFNFEFDTAAQNLTLTADAGAIITANYNYFEAENWQPMTRDFSTLYKTRFTFRTVEENLRECAVKFTVAKNPNFYGDLPQIDSYIAGFCI